MKLHVVAASDCITKGLDLSYPHSALGNDGLLVGPSRVEAPIAAVILPLPEEVPEEVHAQVEEPVADVILVTPEEVPVEELPADEAPVADVKKGEDKTEEKKTAKPKGRPAKTA